MKQLLLAGVIAIAASCSNQKSVNKPAKQGDEIFASIERTACFGKCPIYVLSVYKNGYVTYNGKQFVDHEGLFYTNVEQAVLDSIAAHAMAINYFGLQDEYDSPITDVPSTITTLSIDGKTKRIKNRRGGPKSLYDYEKYLDGLFNNTTWTPLEEQK